MFEISLDADSTESIRVEVLQIITDYVNGGEVFITLIEDTKAQNIKIDSLHYFIRIPLNGFYLVTTTCMKTQKSKDLYVRTSNVTFDTPRILTAHFETQNGMSIRYDKEQNSYLYKILYAE